MSNLDGLVPFTTRPEKVEMFDPQKVLTLQLPCMCGHMVVLKDCRVSWTCKGSDPELGWYAVCNIQCITRNVSVGAC